MNAIHLIGRLTADPEIKTFPDGSEYCNFTIAVDRDYKDKSGQKPSDFFNCKVTRGGAALIGKYFHKGDGIGISGSMESRKYEKDGQSKTLWEVNVKSLHFLPSKSNSNGSSELTEVTDTDDAGLPF